MLNRCCCCMLTYICCYVPYSCMLLCYAYFVFAHAPVCFAFWLLWLYVSSICIYIPSIHVLTSLWSVVVGTKAHASIGARFCNILLLITLKVRFRIKYRILIGFGLFWIYFPVWDILITCKWDVYLFSLFRKFFPVEPRKGGAGEIFRDSGR